MQACGKATLGLYLESGRVTFGALTCGSWSCPSCRKRLAARLLDRLRRGMEARGRDVPRHLVTLTIDPAKFGAVPIGTAYWNADGTVAHDAGRASRTSTLWSEPSAAQFKAATEAMSAEWDRVNKRLRERARRAGLPRPEYFRVVELHRNGWPHYHVVYEHLVGSVAWSLGRVDVRGVDLDGAVGEVAPYLVCSERKSGGHKAYQFAANALPKGFRLWSSSQSFLGAVVTESDGPTVVHGLALRGHFASHGASVVGFGGTSTLALNPPSDEEHRPPSLLYADGDAALVYFAELVHAKAAQIPASQLRVLGCLAKDVPAAPVLEDEEVGVEPDRLVDALYWDSRLGGYVPGRLWFGASFEIPEQRPSRRTDLS